MLRRSISPPSVLDRRVIRLWRTIAAINSAVVAVVLTGAAAVGFFSLYNASVWPWVVVMLLAWAAVVTGLVWLTFVWPRLRFHAWSYRVDDHVVELRNGVIFRKSVSIPVSRLQHVDLHRGPLERRGGLSSLELHTAGTQNASHTIPGLAVETAEQLRDRLIGSIDRGADERHSG